MKKLLFFAASLLLTMTAQASDELVTLPQGVEPEEYTLAITHRVYLGENETQETDKKMTALVAFNGNDVYIQGLPYYFPNSYVKGTLADGKVTFESGQYVGKDQFGNEYMNGFVVENEKGVITPFVFNYNAETRALSFDASINLSEMNAKNGGGFYTDVLKAEYTPGGLPSLVAVEAPEGLKTEPYLLIGTRTGNEEKENGEYEMVTSKYQLPLQIGFDGDDLYIQGLVENISDAWAKATKNAQGNYVIPKGQYIGTSSLLGQSWHYFLSAITRTGTLSAISFSYNEATNTLSTSQTIGVTNAEDKTDSYHYMNNVVIKKVAEREATPSAPEMKFSKQKAPYGSTTWYFSDIFIPLTDTEELPMLSDKLTYMFLVDKGGAEPQPLTFPKSKYYKLENDLTEIPYDYSDGLDISRHTVFFEKLGEAELKTWKRLGLQTIYRGNDVEHRSEITWVDLSDIWNTGIADVQWTPTTVQGEYDLQGRPTDGNARGLVIRRVQQADGTVKTVKVMKR